jgi:hypothetical protein
MAMVSKPSMARAQVEHGTIYRRGLLRRREEAVEEEERGEEEEEEEEKRRGREVEGR